MKRRLRIIAIFLLLGAVVNVGVAWGCLLWSPMIPSSPHGGEKFPKLGPGASWPTSVPGDWPLPSYGSWDYGWFMSTGGFGGYIPKDPEGRPREYGLSIFRYGVPFRALEFAALVSTDRISSSRSFALEFAALMSTDIISSSRSFGFIPLRPIWVGSALNTVFYAALVWLLFAGVSTLRRFLRVRRGLCPKCAYPMGESAVCTECGKALPTLT